MGLVAFVCRVDFRVERNSGALRMLLLVVAGCFVIVYFGGAVALLGWCGICFELPGVVAGGWLCVWRVVRLLVGWLWLALC